MSRREYDPQAGIADKMTSDVQAVANGGGGGDPFATQSRSRDTGDILLQACFARQAQRGGAKVQVSEEVAQEEEEEEEEEVAEPDEEEIRRFCAARSARSESVQHFMDAEPVRRGKKRKAKEATGDAPIRYATRVEIQEAVTKARCCHNYDEGESSCEELERELEKMLATRKRRRRRAAQRHKKRRVHAECSSVDSASAAHQNVGFFDAVLERSNESIDEGDSSLELPENALVRKAYYSTELGRVTDCFWCGWSRNQYTSIPNEHMRELSHILHSNPGTDRRIVARAAHNYYINHIWVEALMRRQFLPLWRTKHILYCLNHHRNEPRLVLAQHLKLLDENIALLGNRRGTVTEDGKLVLNVSAMKEMRAQLKDYWALSERQMERQAFYQPDQRIMLADAEYRVSTVGADFRLEAPTNAVLE